MFTGGSACWVEVRRANNLLRGFGLTFGGDAFARAPRFASAPHKKYDDGRGDRAREQQEHRHGHGQHEQSAAAVEG